MDYPLVSIGALRFDDLYRGKIRGISLGVSGEDFHALYVGMRPNIKVWQRRRLQPASPTISEKRLTSDEGGLPWKRISPKVRSKKLIELFDLLYADGEFRVNDGINDEYRGIRRNFDCSGGPFFPH